MQFNLNKIQLEMYNLNIEKLCLKKSNFIHNNNNTYFLKTSVTHFKTIYKKYNFKQTSRILNDIRNYRTKF